MAHEGEFRTDSSDEEDRKFDRLTHGITTLSEEHRLIHDGMGHTVTFICRGVRRNRTGDLLFAVGDRSAHLKRYTAWSPKRDLEFMMFEGATVSDPGIVVPVQNNNRTDPAFTARTLVSHMPTIIDPGELMEERLVAAGGPGVVTLRADEWVLKPGVKYLMRAKNLGSRTDLSWNAFFYEVQYRI